MKKIKCYDCDKEFVSETSEDALSQMHPHYMKEHEEVIKSANEDQKKVWMDQFNKDWESVEQI